ncbi:MAG: hypothetical protein U0822_03565 [Anaerolineae bacterium]
MAKFRALTKDEVDEMQQPRNKGVSDQRKALAEAYRTELSQYRPGDWVEVTLDAGEKRDTVKNRLKRAARARGVDIEFKRTRGDRLRFQIK